jgi:hypothetical protein
MTTVPNTKIDQFMLSGVTFAVPGKKVKIRAKHR